VSRKFGISAEITNKSKLLRMDSVGIAVESLDDAIAFFTDKRWKPILAPCG
jgi:hypothetical protein